MRIFSRILLIILATLWVTTLGYYAYTIATENLVFPFISSDRQIGNTIQLPVARPSFFSRVWTGMVFDTDALNSSVKKNGKNLNLTVSHEANIIVSGEYLSLEVPSLTAGDLVTIDADAYNSQTKSSYKLPRSIELRWTTVPYNLFITPSGLSRDAYFDVDMYGFEWLDTSDIRWYMHTDPKRNCYMEDAWDSTVWNKIPADQISHNNTGLRDTARYHLSYDTTTPRVCIVAGVAWQFITVLDRAIDDFTVTGSVVSVLSPEYDLQSEIEFRFSHDIFADTWALYSEEYIANRLKEKVAFLQKLDITPRVDITPDQIVMTPSRVSILAHFDEWVEYTIRLRDIRDEYGRKKDTKILFTPISEPFLSLGLPARRTMFRYGEDIEAKLYALKTPKDAYTLKLCRISLEWYARTEKMIAEWKREDLDTIYNMLDGGLDTSECTKSDIHISTGATISKFHVSDMYPNHALKPWLYILAPKEKSVALSFNKVVLPRIFSVIDSQVTMKVDASGKMTFLVTDINTGAPRDNQSVRVFKNITRTYTEEWDPRTEKSIRTYLPFTNRSFATGVTLGSTKQDGVLTVSKNELTPDEYSPPYGLMYEWYGDYEWRYESFLASSEWDNHFGYVVSTWNDGITWWNFGMKDSDYSWDTRGKYTTYLHTDRRLYLPWETVNVHAIMRENNTTLSIPGDVKFQIRVMSPLGAEIQNVVQKPNEFGTLSLSFPLDKSASLWLYSVQVSVYGDDGVTIENWYTNFQVEVFKNPTFTANVKLQSQDIQNDLLMTLRKKENTDPNYPWYKDVYSTTFNVDGIVTAKYYNGTDMKGVPFTYRIYRAPHYDNSYWSDCFWWCYYEASPEFYTEWTGVIDHDGMGMFRVPVDFSSYFDDYVYTAEVIIADPTTGENITTPATLLARIPSEYKEFDAYNPIMFTPSTKLVSPWSVLTWSLSVAHGKIDDSISKKYRYEFVHREYTRTYVDDLRVRDTAITESRDVVMLSGSLSWTNLTLSTQWLSPGEYYVRIIPITDDESSLPESSISESLVYITGNFVDKNSTLKVIPEKTIYQKWDTAKIYIISPFTGWYLYLTRERWGVLDHEYLAMTGNTIVREYPIDDSYYPNVYIGAIAYASGYTHGARNYAVGYGEIVMDISDKKANLTVTADKETYKNREKVNLSLKMTDKKWLPLEGEVAIMVVDESLIRLLWNIDLDIIPKFFRKAPFTLRTALTTIWMERNQFLSRKWSNGGSGDKGGGWVQISSRTLFQNTAYYNPSVRVKSDGTASVSFDLPDNVTDYRIITIGQTKSSLFSVNEKTIQVRRDYTIEPHIPAIAYPWDRFESLINIFNSTKKITNADIEVKFGSGASQKIYTGSVILQSYWQATYPLSIQVDANINGDIPYTVTLRDKKQVLDSITHTINIREVPLLESVTRQAGIMTWSSLNIDVNPFMSSMNVDTSYAHLSFSRTPLTDPGSALRSLIAYPYGCIEQTIASTLPNAIALKFSGLLGIKVDEQKAKENLQVWLSKILRMQIWWGWKYWEDDSWVNDRITPYVVRSLYVFRDMWVDISQPTMDSGIQYLVDRLDWQTSPFSDDPDFLAEVFSTLALAKNTRADALIPRLESYRKEFFSSPTNTRDTKSFSRHGVLMYALWLQYMGKLPEKDYQDLLRLMGTKSDTSSYWYWDVYADRSIYAQLLILRGNISWATAILDDVSRDINPRSYYVSTQAKIQYFIALMRLSEIMNTRSDASLHIRSDGLIADMLLGKMDYSKSIEFKRNSLGNSLNIARTATGKALFYEFLQYDVPKNIYDVRPVSGGGMSVNRTFESIDESKGLDASGNWLITQEVKDKKFQKWKLYRVKLTVTPPPTESPTFYLTLEDYVPGAWRPIRGIFQTESSATSDNNQDGWYWNGWSYVEARDDRIFATSDYLYKTEPRTYTYYIRPEFEWEYLLPPVTAYYMYRPEIHAIGKYEKIQVVE